jgi:aromatic ring-opening dioxygenase LigB subunit
MSLVFAGIVPHPPILIETIGKENLEHLEETQKAFALLEEELYSLKPDTLILISPHGPIQPNAFTMNLSPKFDINFEEFGDFATKLELDGDVGLAHQIKEKIEIKTPFQAISEKKLDHGCGIPLFMLKNSLKSVKIIPIYYSGLDYNAHYIFGKNLKNELLKTKKRVAILASGDLSHRITKNAPAGYSPKGAKFDKKLIDFLTKKKVKNILELNHDLIHEAGECGLKSIAILMGILEEVDCRPEKISYEAPFGVGYLVMNFKL